MTGRIFQVVATALIVGTWVSGALPAAPPRSSLAPGIFDAEQVLWEVELGDHQYTVPRVEGDQIFIGVNDTNLDHPAARSTGGGILMCLDRHNGTRLWQLPIPRYMPGTTPPFHFDHWKCGICSRPAVEDNRLFVVGSRGDVLCIDRDGQANGNDGPFIDEKSYFGIAEDSSYELTSADGDIVWRFDMLQQLGVVPHDVCGSSPTVLGDYIYACTSNGVDDTHLRIPNAQAPSLIALDKQSGRLAATDGAICGDRILHGTWSSPVVADLAQQKLVLYGGGDGVLYAFKPLEGPPREGPPGVLEVVWKYDCCPADYRLHEGQPIPYARWNRNSPEGPSEIIATPIIHSGRVYVAIGQSPIHGPGLGCLSCIDAATGVKIWESRRVDRTITDAVIHDGLLFIADYSGRLHCFDADTGQHYWQQELNGGVWCESPVVVHGLVYISNENKRMWVLRASREKIVVAEGRVRSTAITPVYCDGILYFPAQQSLSAIRLEADAP
ncbi:MAG: PQQ-binding-like beta-propeller repeat protein [Pirellulaceae bacterium]